MSTASRVLLLLLTLACAVRGQTSTSPDTPAPETAAPDTPAPATPVPETPIPPTAIPPTPVPPTPVPPTPVPPTPVPPTPAPTISHPGGCAWISNPTAGTCPSWCTWDCGLKLCYDPYCETRSTAAQCSTVSGCAWSGNKCRDYNLQYGGNTNCALATSAAACGGACQWSAYQNACIAGSVSGACAWLAQNDAKACPTERCSFSAAIGYCYDPTCSAKLTSADCSAQSGCTWYNGYCYDYNLQYSGFACSKAEEVAECPASRCHWDGNACQNGAGAPVILAPAPHNGGCAWANPASCPSGCTYNSDLNLCYDATCPLRHSPAACSAVSGCAWAKNQCRDYNLQYGSIANCALATTPVICGGGSCEWSYKQNKCLSVSSSSACAWLPQNNYATCPDRCSFSAATGLCYNAQCVKATTECACAVLQSAGCTWANGRCLDYNVQYGSYACNAATSKAQCGRSCVWNDATSTCA